MAVGHRQIVRRVQIAELEVMRGHQCNAPRPYQAAEGFFCAGDAVGGIGSFEDFVDADEHGGLPAAEKNHLPDAQQLGIEGGNTSGRIIVYLNRGENMKRCERKELCADRSAGIGKYGG